MKRLICFTIVITMLVGLCFTTGVSASVPTYTTYEINSADFLNGYSAYYYSADGFASLFSWKAEAETGAVQNLPSNPNGRYGEEVYKLTSNAGGRDIFIKIQPEKIQDVRFNEGDIVHLTSEMMISEGAKLVSDYTDNKIGITLSPLFGTKTGDTYDVSAGSSATGIRVANRGKKWYKTHANDMIIGMDTDNQHFSLFGNVNTAETWEYDKWYRFDVVLTMGEKPTASIYVNGDPLTVKPEEAGHFDDKDATFDGIHTISENVAIGTWNGDGSGSDPVFVQEGLYGLADATLVRALSSEKSTIYLGDLAYRAMQAGSDVEIPNALTLLGVNDGGFFDPADLTAVKVQVPEFIKHKTASVELSVDGNIITGTNGVYDLSSIGGGNKSITLIAKDVQGKVLRTSSMSIKLSGESSTPVDNDIHGLDAVTFGGADEANLAGTNFTTFWDTFFVKQGEGFKYNTNPADAATHKAGFRIITAPGGPDGLDDYYAKLEKDDVTAGNTGRTNLCLAYRYNSNRFGAASFEPKVWNDGIVHLSYDILLPAYDAEGVDWAPTESTSTWDTSFDMCIGAPSNKAFNMIRYNEWRNYFTFEGSLPGRSACVPIAVGKWVHFDWKLDYVNRTAEVKVDDYQVMNDKADSPYIGKATLEMSDALANAGFEGVAFNWYGSKGSVGIDNLEIKYELVKPYIKSVDFGTDKAQGNKVLTSAATAAVEIPGKVFSVDGSANMASYVSLVDSIGNAVSGASAVMAADGKTVNVTIPAGTLTAGEEYSIKVSGNIPLGREGHTQVGTDAGDYTIRNAEIDKSYTFIAVDSFEVDGITVNDVRFTTHANSVDEASLAGYAGAGLTEGYKLRADMLVSNGSDSAQTFTMVIATYSGDELVDVAIGGDTVVPAGAKNLTITSAPIVIGEKTNLTAKVLLLNSLGTLTPLSYAYDILGNVAQ